MWRKLQPACDPVTAGSVASFPSLESKSAESTFNQTGWEFSWPCLFFYWKIITWNPDQVSVVMLKKPQWHQSLLLLHQTICLKHQSFKSSAHQHDKTFPAEWQESSVYSTVLYSCNHEQLFPEFQRIQKLKQEQGKLPWTLVSTAFQNDHEWDL